jgi:adenylate cyclase
MLRRLSPFKIAILLGIAMAILRMTGCSYLDGLDARAVDFRLAERGPRPASRQIVIVAVDEASIRRVGRWPWPRATMADLVDRLHAAAPAVIGFDIVQSEATDDSALRAVAGRLTAERACNPAALHTAIATVGDEDSMLAAAVRRAERVVLGYFFNFDKDDAPSALPLDTIATFGVVQNSPDGNGERRVPAARSAVVNLPAITDAGAMTGFFNVFPDRRDGIYRRVPMVLRAGNAFALPLSLSILRTLEPEESLVLRFNRYGVESVSMGHRHIPVAEDGTMLLNYRGPRHAFTYVSAADLLDGKVDPSLLKGKVVVVGVTATGVADVRATPFDGVFPGVEIQATALDNILRTDFIEQPKWVDVVETGAIAIVAVLLGIALQYLHGVGGALAALLLAVLYVAGTQKIFLDTGFLLGLSYPLAAVGVLYTTISVFHYMTESREKRRIRDAFSLYMSPALAKIVSERREELVLGGDEREMTVMFSDIRGFTKMSSELPPTVLVELVNFVLNEMTEVVFAHDGTLDKYMGDAIMALWSAPLIQTDHARRACLAGIGMQARLRELAPVLAERGWPPIRMGVGVHTGPMVVGNMGSKRRLSYTVIGANTNVAARLETMTKVYRCGVIASEAAVKHAGEGFIVREVDLVRVSVGGPMTSVFEVLGSGVPDETTASALALFASGMAEYRERRWTEAAATFERVLAVRPEDGPATVYLERSRAFAGNEPADDWQPATQLDVLK